MLLYGLAGILPNTKVQYFGCSTKGELRDQVCDQYERQQRKNPQRIALLAENLENLPQIVLRLGWAPALFSEELYDRFQEASRARDALQSVGEKPLGPPRSLSPVAAKASPEPPAPRADGRKEARPKALTNGSPAKPQTSSADGNSTRRSLKDMSPGPPEAEQPGKRARTSGAAANEDGNFDVSCDLPELNFGKLNRHVKVEAEIDDYPGEEESPPDLVASEFM